MVRPSRLLPLVLLFLAISTLAVQAQESQRRIVRLESGIYGWYATADPEFDKTIGRRELFKVSGSDQFLKGLAGRLVMIEGVFSDGSLFLPALAPPPVSLADSAQRHIFIVSPQRGEATLTTESGFELLADGAQLESLEPGRWKLDVLTLPGESPNQLRLSKLLQATPLTWSRSDSPSLSTPDSTALIDLTLTQGILDNLTEWGLAQADLQTSYKGLTLALSNLRLQLPDGSRSVQQPWSLQGSLNLGLGQQTSLAESSFMVNAQPFVEDDSLKLKPDWENIQIEGQLPFSFVLGGRQLGAYAQYLPESVPLFDLNLATQKLKSDGLIDPQSEAHWNLATPAPGSMRIALGENDDLPTDAARLQPGLFRLTVGQSVVDRLVKKEADRLFSPDHPYRPEPPIEVGKALFVPILVQEIYIRQLQAGYRQGVFRFDDLVLDIGWQAGPFSGIEPLIETSGYLRPKLTGPDQQLYFSWDLVLEDLQVRSDKIPGDREKLAQEFKPQIETALGSELARDQNFSNRIKLGEFLPKAQGELQVTALQALDKSLTLEGSFHP